MPTVLKKYYFIHEIEAMQFDGTNESAIAIMNEFGSTNFSWQLKVLKWCSWLHSSRMSPGSSTVKKGDYIYRSKGSTKVLSKETFEGKYNLVKEDK